MHIEIITIGHEILCGSILDTNFSYLAKRISEEGYSVARHTSVPDDPVTIEECLNEALKRSDVILTTGGLGPTLDDKTKDIMAKVFKKRLELNHEICADLVTRYGPDLVSIEHQATVPLDTKILHNSVGTAPGFVLHQGKSMCCVMPGVPIEMQTMFEKEVLPYLKETLNKSPKKLVRTVYLCHLSENVIDPYLRILDQQYPQVEKGIYPGYGVLSVEFKLQETPSAAPILQKCVDTLVAQFGSYLFSLEDKSLSLAVHHYMLAHKKTLALAESCTGGHMAAKLVDHAGASAYFLGSVVCYSNEIKKRSLGVKEQTLRHYGAVSREVLEEMLKGILDVSQADYALAVTGVAGPGGGTLEKPVGTVWCGLAVRGEPMQVGKILAKGRVKRASMIEYTANFMLGVLWRKVAYNLNTLS